MLLQENQLHFLFLVFPLPQPHQDPLDEVSPGFQEFLDLLGKKIELKGTKEYTGGLNTDGTCGDHTYFTKYKDISMAFHVAPMIPQLV